MRAVIAAATAVISNIIHEITLVLSLFLLTVSISDSDEHDKEAVAGSRGKRLGCGPRLPCERC